MGLQLGERGLRRLRLHRQHDDVEGPSHLVRRQRRDDLRELLDRPRDAKAPGAAGLHMLRHLVDQHHVEPGAFPIGAERAADGAGAPDQNG